MNLSSLVTFEENSDLNNENGQATLNINVDRIPRHKTKTA